MEANFTDRHKALFASLINCTVLDGEKSMPVGVTRMGELDVFTDAFMKEWTTLADSDITHTFTSMPLLDQAAFLQHRFCTYSEFEQLHTRHNGWDAPVFKLLGIRDAEQQDKYKKQFTRGREGYFSLMEVVNPQMRTFFFPSVPCLYPIS